MLPHVSGGMLISAVIIKKNSSNCQCSPCKILIREFRFGVNGKSLLHGGFWRLKSWKYSHSCCSQVSHPVPGSHLLSVVGWLMVQYECCTVKAVIFYINLGLD